MKNYKINKVHVLAPPENNQTKKSYVGDPTLPTPRG